jgi:hypothetical protein
MRAVCIERRDSVDVVTRSPPTWVAMTSAGRESGIFRPARTRSRVARVKFHRQIADMAVSSATLARHNDSTRDRIGRSW